MVADMKALRTYIYSMPPDERKAFAIRAGTSIGYLTKALSTRQRFDVALVVELVKASDGELRPQDLRPDVDWAAIRASLNEQDLR